jgi:hypothetical protein
MKNGGNVLMDAVFLNKSTRNKLKIPGDLHYQ